MYEKLFFNNKFVLAEVEVFFEAGDAVFETIVGGLIGNEGVFDVV